MLPIARWRSRSGVQRAGCCLACKFSVVQVHVSLWRAAGGVPSSQGGMVSRSGACHDDMDHEERCRRSHKEGCLIITWGGGGMEHKDGMGGCLVIAWGEGVGITRPAA